MAGERRCDVDSASLETFLVSKGFVPTTQNNEIVYCRKHDREPRLVIKIYSSIRIGADIARPVGKDAIRVVALFCAPAKVYPIFKSARVYRTGSQEKVHDRVLERSRAAYRRCNEWLKEKRQDNEH